MNQERLLILQDLSKGSKIYLEESERRPEAVNLDALMRSTAAGQEAADWEVYAKKKIGENITLWKKFTPDGKVSVILDLRGELSISDYDFETGKRVLGEGYLQVSKASSPIEATVTSVSLVRNGDAQNPRISGSDCLSTEFNQMLNKASSIEESVKQAEPELTESVEPSSSEAISSSEVTVTKEYIDLKLQEMETRLSKQIMLALASNNNNSSVDSHLISSEPQESIKTEGLVQNKLQQNQEPEEIIDIEPTLPALPEDKQLAAVVDLDPSEVSKETESEADNTPEVINLAVIVASKVVSEEMRKEGLKTEERIMESQRKSEKEIEELNIRYSVEIAKLHQEHEERVREMTARIGNLEAEKARLESEMEKQSKDYERKLTETSSLGSDSGTASIGYGAIDIYIPDFIVGGVKDVDPGITAKEDKKTDVDLSRNKRGRYVGHDGLTWKQRRQKIAEEKGDDRIINFLDSEITFIGIMNNNHDFNEAEYEDLNTIVIFMPSIVRDQKGLITESIVRKMLTNKTMEVEDIEEKLKRRVRRRFKKAGIDIPEESLDKIKILLPQRLRK